MTKAGKRWLNYLAQGGVEKSSKAGTSIPSAKLLPTSPFPLHSVVLPFSKVSLPVTGHSCQVVELTLQTQHGACSAQGMIPGAYSSPLLTLTTPLRVGVYSHYPCSVL